MNLLEVGQHPRPFAGGLTAKLGTIGRLAYLFLFDSRVLPVR